MAEGETKRSEEAAKSSKGAAKHPKGITKHPEGRSLSCELLSDYCEDQTDGTQYHCYMALYLDHQLVRRFPLMPGRHIYPLLPEGDVRKRDDLEV